MGNCTSVACVDPRRVSEVVGTSGLEYDTPLQSFPPAPMPYHAHLENETRENDAFRRVLLTGAKSQLVVMTIPPGGEVGKERHDHVEQIFFIQSGRATAYLDQEEKELVAGDVLVVTPGVMHNIVVTGDSPLKLSTVYAPANHIDGRVHATKADADVDVEDETFGHGVV